MVACMPACASFSRFFFTKFGILSTIKSRLSSSKGSKQNLSMPKPVTPASNPPSGSQGDPAGWGKYWRLQSPFSNTRDGTSPPNSFNKQQPGVLQSDDFNVFDDSKRSPFLTETKKNESVELKEQSFEREQASANVPYNIV